MNITDLSKKYHVGRQVIQRHFEKGEFIGSHQYRKWDIDESSFLQWYNKNYIDGKYNKFSVNWNRNIFNNIDTPSKAYWLGFILADGNLRSECYTVSIDIGAKDKEHLIKFINFIEGSESMLQRTFHPTTGNELYHVQICGKDFYMTLVNLGLFPRKSGKEQYISTPFDKDFIRGIIDGDGFIRQDLTEIGLVGSYELLQAVQNKILKYTQVQPRKILEHGIIYKISYRAKNDIYKIVQWLYQDASISLSRK